MKCVTNSLAGEPERSALLIPKTDTGNFLAPPMVLSYCVNDVDMGSGNIEWKQIHNLSRVFCELRAHIETDCSS
jgi:hypothetical protein